MTLPTISIIVPTLGRPKGLKRCIESLKNLAYPKSLYTITVNEDKPRRGVPYRLKEGIEATTGEYIVFASNDTEFAEDSLFRAILCSLQTQTRLVAFNTGTVLPDEGNICEHFVIARSLIDKLDGKEIFCTEFHHVGVDNYLWAQAKKLNEAIRCDDALVRHYHFSHGSPMDDVYQLGWSKVEEDRALLKRKLEKLYPLQNYSKPYVIWTKYKSQKETSMLCLISSEHTQIAIQQVTKEHKCFKR